MIPSFSKPHLPDRECWLRPADNDHHTCLICNVTIGVHFESNETKGCKILMMVMVLTKEVFRFEMSQLERGLTEVKLAHSGHEEIFKNPVWTTSKRVAYRHRNEPGSVC